MIYQFLTGTLVPNDQIRIDLVEGDELMQPFEDGILSFLAAYGEPLLFFPVLVGLVKYVAMSFVEFRP